MLKGFVLYHRTRVNGDRLELPNSAGPMPFVWETCLRQIAVNFMIEPASTLDSSWERKEGEASYQFLLEVISGLHSPIVGETEVLGQFREAMEAYIDSLPDGPELSRARFHFQQLSRDAKSVRSKFLKGLGSQSYGSALRKQLESTGEVAILGAGQLVEEILPWISGVGRTIRVFCRNPEKASLRLAKFPDLEIANFNQISPFLGNAGSRAVVVAAPIPAKALNNLLVLLGNANHLVDFRADSDLDLLSGPESVRRLSDFFRELEASASFQYEQVEKAKAAIRALTKQRDNGVAHRPFGWEDVCA